MIWCVFYFLSCCGDILPLCVIIFLKELWFSCPLTFHPAVAEPRTGKLYSSSSYFVLSDSVISCWCFGLTTASAQSLSFNAHGGAFKVGTWGYLCYCQTFFLLKLEHRLFFLILFCFNLTLFYIIYFECNSNNKNSFQMKL